MPSTTSDPVVTELRRRIAAAPVHGDIVAVGSFLNHRIDCELATAIGRCFARRLPGPVDAVVTSEASGIVPAFTTAAELGVPMVFAKKRRAPLPDSLARRVPSATKGDRPWLVVDPEALDGVTRAVVVDDFLAAGRTAAALADMLADAQVDVEALGFVVEKAWTGGRALLEGTGHRVESLVTVVAVEEGRAVLA